MRRIRIVVLILLVLGACKKNAEKVPETDPPSPIETKKLVAYEGTVIENIPYRFRLAQPGPNWQLLEHDDARQIASDAQAAVSIDTGLTAVVIVEHVPGLNLEQMSTLILESMPIEGKSFTARESEIYVGLPALRFEVSGLVNDIPMDYAGRIFLREEFSYQVIAFAPRGTAKKEDWDRAFESFSLTDGEIKPVIDNTISPDMIGVGWRLKDGVFESAVSGLRVSPQSGWRAVVGAEARRMNADAEVVLVHQAPDAYFLVIPERIGASSEEAYTMNRVDSTAVTLKGTVKRTQIKSELLGKTVDSTVLSEGEVPWTFQVSVAFDKGWAVQATGWYAAGVGEDGEKAIAEAMKSVAWLPQRERDALRRELLAAPDQQDVVGSAFSLRSGVFRDYEYGLQWAKPKGFWELSVGQEVRAINPRALLYGRYSNSALHILLIADDSIAEVDASSYHERSVMSVQQRLGLDVTKSKQKSRIGSGAALLSDGKTTTGGIDLGYRIVTAASGKRGVQLHIWGVATSMKEHALAAALAARALELHPRLPASEMRKGVYLDHRLGFSMKLDREYRYTDSTPAELAGIGSYPTWGVDGKDWIGVLALRAIEAGRDREWSMNLMEDRIRESFSKIVKSGIAKKEEVTLVGMPARHLSWTANGMRLDAYLVRRHQTIYALAATDAGGDSDMINKAIAGFRLID